jgi:hypothetical protein
MSDPLAVKRRQSIKNTYDYIVVGAGVAGSVVASANGTLAFPPPQLSSQRFLPRILDRNQDTIGISCPLVAREHTAEPAVRGQFTLLE